MLRLPGRGRKRRTAKRGFTSQTRLAAAERVCRRLNAFWRPAERVWQPAKPVWRSAKRVWRPAKPVCPRTNAFARALSGARDQQFLRTGLQPVRPTGEIALREVCGGDVARFAEAALPCEGHDLVGSEEADERRPGGGGAADRCLVARPLLGVDELHRQNERHCQHRAGGKCRDLAERRG